MKKIIVSCLVLIIFASCTPIKVYIETEGNVSVHEEQTFKEHIRSITIDDKEIELIEETELENVNHNKLITITLKNTLINEFAAFTAQSITIDASIHAPFTYFFDPVMNTTMTEIDQGRYPTKPIDKISLPNKAVSVDGFYPNDSKYPLTFVTKALFNDTSKLSTAADRHTNYKKQTAKKIYDMLAPLYPQVSMNEDVHFISFAGDIMAGRGVDRTLSKDNGIQEVFGKVLPILQDADLTIGNLEGAITTQENRVYKSYNFKFPYFVLPKLSEAGFDYLSITNNHSFDYGLQGFKDTLTNLEKAKIGTSGAGLKQEDALKPWQTKLGTIDVDVYSLADYPSEIHFAGKTETEVTEKTPGVLWPTDKLLEQIKKSVKEEHFVIVLVHGGYEWRNSPSKRQTDLYRELVSSGANIVVGSHPHVLQPMEVTSEKGLIAYSIGNFIFPGMDETEYGEETIALEVGLHAGEIKYVHIYPAHLSQIGIDLDTTGIIEKRFHSMNESWSMQ